MRENPKTHISTYDLPWFVIFYQKPKIIPGSIGTFWYKGSAEKQGKRHVREKAYICQKQQPKTKSVIFQKMSRYGEKRLILSRYDIIFNI